MDSPRFWNRFGASCYGGFIRPHGYTEKLPINRQAMLRNLWRPLIWLAGGCRSGCNKREGRGYALHVTGLLGGVSVPSQC